MALKYIITFKREPVDCDMAERFCPIERPCNNCNEWFNTLPILERMAIEIPRRWRLLWAYGWAAANNGSGTAEDVARYHERRNER